jgi:HEAT repeat protein
MPAARPSCHLAKASKPSEREVKMKHTTLPILLFATFLSLPRPITAQGSPANPSPQSSTQAAQPTGSSVDPLVTLLETSKSVKVRARAARDLGQTANLDAIPALAKATSDPSVQVRREVVIALAQFHGSQVIDALIRSTRDGDEGVRILAVRSLVGYYTGNVPKPGFEGFLKKNWRRAKHAFAQDNTQIDPGVYVDPKVVNALIDSLKDQRSVEVEQEAARGLGILLARPAVPALVESAHSSDVDLARESLNALSKIKDVSAGPRLVDLLDSRNNDIKRDTAVTVGILRTEQAVPKLQAIFNNDSNKQNRGKALTGLAYIGSKVSVPLFSKALWSNDRNFRIAAAEGLARARDPQTLSELQKAVMAEKKDDAKLAMEFAITALGHMDYLSSLVGDLDSRRGDAARAYLVELARHPEFLPRLYPYLESRNDTVRRRLCTVLMYSGNQSSLEELDHLTHDPNADVAGQAMRARQAIRARLSRASAHSDQ